MFELVTYRDESNVFAVWLCENPNRWRFRNGMIGSGGMKVLEISNNFQLIFIYEVKEIKNPPIDAYMHKQSGLQYLKHSFSEKDRFYIFQSFWDLKK